jgi:hypothetical protein
MATDYNALAAELVDDELGASGVSKMPDAIHEWCVGQVAKRLGEIDRLSNGVVQYGPDGETSFMSGDPLKPVQSTLNRYKKIGAIG